MQNLIEALKEPGRLVSLAVVSWLLSEGLDAALKNWGGSLSAENKMMLTGVLTAILRGIDKYLHELGKETGKANLIGGLTRF